MSALELLQYVNYTLILVIAVLVAAAAFRRPTVSNVDSALLFLGLAFVVVQGRVTAFFQIPPSALTTALAFSVFMVLPYLLLRLARDFSAHVRRTQLGIAEIGLAVAILAIVLYAPAYPTWLTTGLLAYFTAVTLVASVAFVRESQITRGVTRRRMQAIALGTALLGIGIGAAAATLVLTGIAGLVGAAVQVVTLAAFVAWAIGFTPPRMVRRLWQEPELRAFLGRAALLPRLPDTASIIGELQEGAAASTGASAVLALWDEDLGLLRLHRDAEETLGPESIAWRVFQEQRAVSVDHPEEVNPARAGIYAKRGIGALLAAPITAGDRRLGVLVVYAERAPVFAEDDLELTRLLADQAAVILESRALIDEAARVRAHEEAARLKEDFVSAAAHDLKTPLTTIVAQAQLLERRLTRDPDARVDPAGMRRIVDESRRLASLVEELLDASRVEQGALELRREPIDLGEIVDEVAARPSLGATRPHVERDEPVVGLYDRVRLAQVVANLVENAAKYSPEGTPIEIRVWRDHDEARLSVTDHGIGIPPDDLPRIFERFRRGRNVDDRRFAGMGLGLYICRGIVAQHEGRIWAESERGRGSVFHVALPLASAEERAPEPRRLEVAS